VDSVELLGFVENSIDKCIPYDGIEGSSGYAILPKGRITKVQTACFRGWLRQRQQEGGVAATPQLCLNTSAEATCTVIPSLDGTHAGRAILRNSYWTICLEPGGWNTECFRVLSSSSMFGIDESGRV